MPYKNKDIMQTIGDVVKHLNDLQAATVDLQTDDVVAFSEKVDAAQKKVTIVKTMLGEQMATSTWKVKQARSVMRGEYQKKRWQNTKVANRLVAGGYLIKHGQYVADLMMKAVNDMDPGDTGMSPQPSVVCGEALIDPSAEEFNTKSVVIWSKPVPDTHLTLPTNREV